VLSWSELIEKHGPLVWRTVRRLVSHDADAADCFQEVFVAALKMSQQQKVLSWSATLRHLANIKAMDCLRRRYRDGARPPMEMSCVPANAKGHSPDQKLVENELATALRIALSTLDPRHAEVFCMICLESMTYQETAEAIGVNVSHVGVLLHRARTELRTKLQSYAPPSTNAKTKGVNSNATHK
jgi:RNA polymerase sigma-70 factor, ECF subfamily